MKKITLSAVLGFAMCLSSPAKEITLTVNHQPGYGLIRESDEISIGTNETAQVSSIYGPGGPSSYLHVVKNGVTNSAPAWMYQGNGSFIVRSTPTVSGPATIRLVAVASETWFCTVKIEPESFPPDKTIIIPQGTPGANIIMEQSRDLINWTNSVPGLYTNTAISHLFFRLRAERLQ